MAKSAEKAAAAASGDGDTRESYVKRILEINAQKMSITMKAKADCKPLVADIKELKNEAKADGFDPKEIMAAVSHIELERKQDSLREDLDNLDSYDNLLLSLGVLADTPLGEAAAKAAKPAKSDDDEWEEAGKDAKPAEGAKSSTPSGGGAFKPEEAPVH